MRHDITKIAPEALDDRQRRSLHRLVRAVEAEVRLPPGQLGGTTYPDFVMRLVQTEHGITEHCWAAWNARGQAVGIAWLTLRDALDFQRVGKFRIEVDALYRRRGMGSALLSAVRTWAESNKVETLYAWAVDSSAGAGFLADRLEQFRGKEIWSVLNLQQLDLQSVVRRAVQPTGPRLDALSWTGPCPSELLDAYAECHRLIGATVRGSQAGSEKVTPQLIGTLEADAVRNGKTWLTAAAANSASQLVGFSQITPPAEVGGLAGQEYTGVVPEWRGRGVAGWLKARVLLQLLDYAPQTRGITTENSGANEAILAANAHLGFQTYVRWSAWETTVTGASA
jgi:GNAT superfamily N-acetyltransferase